MAGHRRTRDQVEGDREARSIAASLGRVVREARRRRRWTQARLGASIGLSHSRIGDIERGHGTGTALIVWARLGAVLDRPLAAAFSRDLDPATPADAGHLAGQELVLGLARATGRRAWFELPTRPADPRLSCDVGIRDDSHRTLILCELWNRLDDLGRAVRSTDRKVAEAVELAVGLGGERPYRVRSCWLLVDTAANRRLVARYPQVLATRFPGSSREWVRALSGDSPAPVNPGIAWIDLRAGRLVPMRRRPASAA
jgi:transcriptional regulator with XRE-family HTH domain